LALEAQVQFQAALVVIQFLTLQPQLVVAAVLETVALQVVVVRVVEHQFSAQPLEQKELEPQDKVMMVVQVQQLHQEIMLPLVVVAQVLQVVIHQEQLAVQVVLVQILIPLGYWQLVLVSAVTLLAVVVLLEI
jgi:hypothetical protein